MNQVPIKPIATQAAQQPQCVAQPQAQQKYNAVNIEISNPSVGIPNQQPMTYYTYPQNPVYTYPPAQQPVYYPPINPGQVVNTTPTQQTTPEQQPAPVQEPVNQTPATTVVPTPVVSEPTVTQQPAQAQQPAQTTDVKPENAPEVVKPETVAPQIDLNNFVGRLTNPDFDTQSSAMEEISDVVKNSPEKATELVDTKIIDALNNIIAFDSSKLEGPTKEQMDAREKIMSNKDVTAAEKDLANKITPKEQAERNKSYALFTTAIIDKLYKDEVAKLQNGTVPMLTELPGIMSIVDNLKDNPNPMVRASAIESLSYIQDPAYKKDLETVFTVAQKDSDPSVASAAKDALAKLAQ